MMVSCLCVDNIWTPDPYCYNSRESNMMTTNEEVNLYVQIPPNGDKASSRGQGRNQFNAETLYFELFSFKWRTMG